jgi:hypothetical protein
VLAARAVLLGNIGAAQNSVKIMLQDRPAILCPKYFINMYANLIPKVVFVVTLDSDRTKNKNHGTVLLKPEKLCLTSIVPVKFAINNDVQYQYDSHDRLYQRYVEGWSTNIWQDIREVHGTICLYVKKMRLRSFFVRLIPLCLMSRGDATWPLSL